MLKKVLLVVVLIFALLPLQLTRAAQPSCSTAFAASPRVYSVGETNVLSCTLYFTLKRTYKLVTLFVNHTACTANPSLWLSAFLNRVSYLFNKSYTHI